MTDEDLILLAVIVGGGFVLYTAYNDYEQVAQAAPLAGAGLLAFLLW